MSNRKKIHDRVLNATDQEELASAYSEWAENYDKARGRGQVQDLRLP